jgi:hypothetical protein
MPPLRGWYFVGVFVFFRCLDIAGEMHRRFFLPDTTRRGSQFPFEHGDEGAGAGVADVERDVGYRRAGGEKSQCLDDAQPLPPLLERDSGFGAEEALDGAFAGSGLPGEDAQRFCRGGSLFQQRSDANGAGIRWGFELQRGFGQGVELIEDDGDHVGLRRNAFIKDADANGRENQFTQQQRDVNRGTFARHGFGELRNEEE